MRSSRRSPAPGPAPPRAVGDGPPTRPRPRPRAAGPCAIGPCGGAVRAFCWWARPAGRGSGHGSVAASVSAPGWGRSEWEASGVGHRAADAEPTGAAGRRRRHGPRRALRCRECPQARAGRPGRGAGERTCPHGLGQAAARPRSEGREPDAVTLLADADGTGGAPFGHDPDPAAAQASRKARRVAAVASGRSACSQWPASGMRARRAAGNRARIGPRCSGRT